MRGGYEAARVPQNSWRGGGFLWPLTAGAQQIDVMQRIGVLEATGEDDPQNKTKYAAFEKELQQLGWTKGRNLRIDYRWGGGDPDTIRKQADELLALQPSVVLASGSSGTGQMLRATRTVPIVFAIITDPVGSGYIPKFGAARRQRHRLCAVRI